MKLVVGSGSGRGGGMIVQICRKFIPTCVQRGGHRSNVVARLQNQKMVIAVATTLACLFSMILPQPILISEALSKTIISNKFHDDSVFGKKHNCRCAVTPVTHVHICTGTPRDQSIFFVNNYKKRRLQAIKLTQQKKDLINKYMCSMYQRQRKELYVQT